MLRGNPIFKQQTDKYKVINENCLQYLSGFSYWW